MGSQRVRHDSDYHLLTNLTIMGFPGGSVVKNPLANAGDEGSISGLPLEKELATHSRILAWEVSWTEDRVGLQSRI